VERIVDDEVAAADVQAPPQAPPQPPRNVEASRPAKQVATTMGPQESPQARQASGENRSMPRRFRRHRR
jgi:hypothetical protein